jgi:hypothetical protein
VDEAIDVLAAVMADLLTRSARVPELQASVA